MPPLVSQREWSGSPWAQILPAPWSHMPKGPFSPRTARRTHRAPQLPLQATTGQPEAHHASAAARTWAAHSAAQQQGHHPGAAQRAAAAAAMRPNAATSSSCSARSTPLLPEEWRCPVRRGWRCCPHPAQGSCACDQPHVGPVSCHCLHYPGHAGPQEPQGLCSKGPGEDPQQRRSRAGHTNTGPGCAQGPGRVHPGGSYLMSVRSHSP